jgi:hypothetical protein
MNCQECRKSIAPRLFSGFIAAFAIFGLVLAQAGKEPGKEPGKEAKAGAAPANKYIGADKCKNCHQSETKNQYTVWQKTDHAKAFATLGTDVAKKLAKEKGIDDPQKSDKCVKCHVTAFGVAADMIKKGFDPKLGVQCESCHGPGEQHMKARMAAAAKAGGESAEKGKVAAYLKLPEGEIGAVVDQKTCLICHNEESPGFKPFCFYERVKKIEHLDARKPHPDPMMCGCGEKCACKNGCETGKCGVPLKDKK